MRSLAQVPVAFLGLGAMGLPMALNLVRKGFAVTGWNRTREKGRPLAEAGGRLASSPAEAVREAEFIVTMLADPVAVREVATGPQGFLPAARAGAVWLECSTIGPTAARENAGAARAAGVTFVDAPVLGSVGPATDGTLVFLVGGPGPAVIRSRPVLEAMGTTIHHMGPEGMGAAAKIVSNMLVGTLVAAVGEALALAGRLGLDRERMADLIVEGPGSAPIVRTKTPLMKAEDFPPAFQLRWMEKDLALALYEAHRLGASLATAAGAHAEYTAARVSGLGGQDFAVVAAYLRSASGGPAATG